MFFWNWRKYTADKCGHRTRRYGKVRAFGEAIRMRLELNSNNSVDYCFECLAKMAIRCAWCGRPIFIRDPVTLYIPDDDFEAPSYAVIHRRKPLTLVGCMRFGCVDTGADRAGFWLPGEDGRGRVWRVPTVYELMLVPSELMEGPSLGDQIEKPEQN